MLVLSRKAGESIRVGDDIEIKVTAISGGRVRIGVAAPREQRIERAEVAEGGDGKGDGGRDN